jgi:hypothetical protein
MSEIASTLGMSRATVYRNGNGCLKKGTGNGSYRPLQSSNLGEGV